MILKNPYLLLNMFSRRIHLVLLFSSLLTLCFPAAAQVPNLSNVRSSQLSDEQLSAYLQKAMQSGLSQDQIEAELKRRGLSDQELMSLQSRIAGLQKNKGSIPVKTGKQTPDSTQNSRTAAPLPVTEAPAAILKEGYPVFGSEIFSNGNIRFEPDTRMATPASYILGPEDVINVDLSGLNDKTQKLKVSPEGSIRIDYAGEVFVSGLSVTEATQRIRSKLSQIYPGLASGGTRLSVSLSNIRSIRVMVMGAVSKPAVYTVSSLSTVFHALYAAGGPEAEGSLRKIELIRGNKVISVIDVYRFLMRGDQSQNIRLQDNDVLRVPFADQQVALLGQVRRTGWFELLPGETMKQLLEYAGGFKDAAFRSMVTAERFTSKEREVIDIPDSLFGKIQLKSGDRITVGSVLERYHNEVRVTGAVFRPGRYELEKGMTLRRLLEKANGLREDAYLGSAILYRLQEDRRKEVLTIQLDSLLKQLVPDVALRNEDQLIVYNKFELETEASITVNGEVKTPATFPWREQLSLASLLQLAGGLTEFASYQNIEIARRLPRVDPTDPAAELTQKIVIHLDSISLMASAAGIILKPYDVVSVRMNPYKKAQDLISISGQVLYPGTYTLLNKTERMSSLYARSGGPLADASLSGAVLLRKRRAENRMDTALLKKLIVPKGDSSNNSLVSLSDTIRLAIDLPAALAAPGSPSDILLEPNDELQIPRFDPTIQVAGDVLNPLSTYYSKSSLRYYINASGGFLKSADKNKIYVIYPNGIAASTRKKLLIFRDYPSIKAGSRILVPGKYNKPMRSNPNMLAGAGVLASILATMTTVILSLR